MFVPFHQAPSQQSSAIIISHYLYYYYVSSPKDTVVDTSNASLATTKEWIPLTSSDVGCGDASLLIQWQAMICSDNIDGVRFIGIELDPDRAALAQQRCTLATTEAQQQQQPPLRHPVSTPTSTSFTTNPFIYCGNALSEHANEIYHDVTIFFLNLIPRGLRSMLPILLELATKRCIHVVTYMSPLPGILPMRQGIVEVDHQPGAKWPLYLYQIDKTHIRRMEHIN